LCGRGHDGQQLMRIVVLRLNQGSLGVVSSHASNSGAGPAAGKMRKRDSCASISGVKLEAVQGEEHFDGSVSDSLVAVQTRVVQCERVRQRGSVARYGRAIDPEPPRLQPARQAAGDLSRPTPARAFRGLRFR